VRLRTENTREVRTIRNVIGILRGTDEPERRILLSNHHDAWVYGAVDPSSGTASLIALARAFGQLAREGFRPRRTIVFGSWDAEEYTLTGSTEWGEEHESELSRDAVVCINVDASASGRDFSASASPLLFSILREVARDLPDPGASGRSIADSWRERAGRQNVRSYATGAAAGEELPVAILGSGSDYTVFFNRLGVSSADLIFDGPYGVYHSVYDTYRWMEQVGDPGFLYHAAMAQYAGLLALRFANADAFPFDAPAYGREIARYSQQLAAEPGAKGLAPELESLARRAREWSEAARGAQRVFAARVASGQVTGAALRRYNEWLLSLERGLLDPAGLPGRPWFRHLIYAPLPSYEAETLPGVREALRTGGGEAARREIARLASKLEAAAAAGRRLARTVPLARKTSGP
jgi:N-acetylated-alpha-linked acidic dipeptidase